ncbi:MAG: glycosyltransferase [Flavobacteriaceae bacterium]
MNKAKIAIVVPAYNEYERFPLREFKSFLTNYPEACLCLVNDASTDNTETLFNGLVEEYPQQIILLKNPKNLGKAASVQKGVMHCFENEIARAIAYLDADLATSLEECYSYLDYLPEKEFVFASRILKVGSVVERRFSRFLIGRILATAISNILDLKVYDTQCGCKVFRSDLSPLLFKRAFNSKWLFDVELFSRLLNHYGRAEAIKRMEEVPVKRWVDRGASKVKMSYFFRLWYDLFQIHRSHKKGAQKKDVN